MIILISKNLENRFREKRSNRVVRACLRRVLSLRYRDYYYIIIIIHIILYYFVFDVFYYYIQSNNNSLRDMFGSCVVHVKNAITLDSYFFFYYIYIYSYNIPRIHVWKISSRVPSRTHNVYRIHTHTRMRGKWRAQKNNNNK